MGRDFEYEKEEDPYADFGGTAGKDRSPRKLRTAKKPKARERIDRPKSWQPAFDRNAAPSGYDKNIWHAVLLFEQRAEEEGISLAIGRPILYNEILNRFSKDKKLQALPDPYDVLAKMVELFWWEQVLLDEGKWVHRQFLGIDEWNYLRNELVQRSQIKSAVRKLNEAQSESEAPVETRQHPPRPRRDPILSLRHRTPEEIEEAKNRIRQRREDT